MDLKRDLTPLDAVPDLEGPVRDKLRGHSITTAEELLGQIEAEPAGMAELLGADEGYVRDLKERARQAIPAETAAAIERQKGREYSLGALPPDEQPGQKS